MLIISNKKLLPRTEKLHGFKKSKNFRSIRETRSPNSPKPPELLVA